MIFLRRHNLFWLLLAALIVVLDQVSKYLVSLYLIPDEMVTVWPFFSLFYIFNTGAAFSFLANASGWQGWVFGGLAAVVSLVILRWLVHIPPTGRNATKFALMLIMGGAIGNLIDRVVYHYVRDFLYFHWHNFYWPSFNIADSAICVGAFILIFELLQRDAKH